MKKEELRYLVRELLAEAKKDKEKKAKKKEVGVSKSGGKLVDLKKELKSLKAMKESLTQYSVNETMTQEPVVAEYSHLQKFVNELNKLKEASSKLSEMLDGQIEEVENKITSEKNKIKEMMGLASEEASEEPKEKSAEKSK